MEQLTRDFKGVWIPKEIWLDERLSALDKIILAEIDSLDQSESGCFASNKYIADFCQCSVTKVSTAISKLIDLGYLETISFDGRQRILKSSLSNFERQTFKKCKADNQNLKDINIYSNTSTNTERKKERKKPAASSYDAVVNEYTQSDELRQAIWEFIKMRQMIKKPLTDRALRLILSKLDALATADSVKVDIINQSIINNWQGVFPLKSGSITQRQQQPQQIRPETDEERQRRQQADEFAAMLDAYSAEG